MITTIAGLIAILAGLFGVAGGYFIYNDLAMILMGGVIAIIGSIFVVGNGIALLIEEAGNKNISALNEIITGLSD